jgi:hypothetical protein
MLKPGEPDVYLPSSCRPNRFLRTTHDVHYGRRALRWHKPLALARSLCGNGRVATLLAQLGMTRTRKIERLAVEYNLTEHCNLACHGCGRASASRSTVWATASPRRPRPARAPRAGPRGRTSAGELFLLPRDQSCSPISCSNSACIPRRPWNGWSALFARRSRHLDVSGFCREWAPGLAAAGLC